MTDELISIIVPIYNTNTTYLTKCIESILSQTYKNIEVLLIDDGSTNGVGDIIDRYGETDDRIKVIHKNNSGVSDTRNIGVDRSSGDWIMFVDADDWLEPDCCESFSKLFNLKADIVFAKTYLNYEDGKIERANNKYNTNIESVSKNDALHSLLVGYRPEFQFLSTPWAKVYRKDFIKGNEIKFKLNQKLGEDSLFNYECIINAQNISYLNSFVYHYFINNLSVTNKGDGDYFKQYAQLFKEYDMLHKRKRI